MLRSEGLQMSFDKLRSGLLLAVLIGVLGFCVKKITGSPMADPLLVSIILGIICRSLMRDNNNIKPGIAFAPTIFIPAGIVFYAMYNLNFAKFANVEKSMIVLLIVVLLVYFVVILLYGRRLGLRKQIIYLIATGSAICGASAIAMTSPAVEAEPDDTSISLLTVAIASFAGFSIILPFLGTLFDITGRTYGLLAGSVLQFTGLVKAAAGNIPYLKTTIPTHELISLSISVKAVRYLGLLPAIPLFASFIKGKLYVPRILWVFLLAGLVGTWMYVNNETYYETILSQYIKPVHDISWSIAMAAIGLNADVKGLLSKNGTKALRTAFTGFFAATIAFFMGLYVIRFF